MSFAQLLYTFCISLEATLGIRKFQLSYHDRQPYCLNVTKQSLVEKDLVIMVPNIIVPSREIP
uniref:Uncharacterized protein n=1 Tax=Onchocerca volvulus TaxID=6282 RepID=A0A8R1TU54_ONCVO